MSMLCSIYRLTQEQVRMAQASPEYVVQLLGQAPLPQKVGFFSRLFGRSSNAVVASAQALQPIAEGEIFELGQAWHILHFLFTGTAEEGEWPGGFVMSGGTEIGPDLGYGPARLFSAEQAREIAAFLETQLVRVRSTKRTSRRKSRRLASIGSHRSIQKNGGFRSRI